MSSSLQITKYTKFHDNLIKWSQLTTNVINDVNYYPNYYGRGIKD